MIYLLLKLMWFAGEKKKSMWVHRKMTKVTQGRGSDSMCEIFLKDKLRFMAWSVLLVLIECFVPTVSLSIGRCEWWWPWSMEPRHWAVHHSGTVTQRVKRERWAVLYITHNRKHTYKSHSRCGEKKKKQNVNLCVELLGLVFFSFLFWITH